MHHILLAQNDLRLSGRIEAQFAAAGHRVDTVGSCGMAGALLAQCRYDLLVLDTALPDFDWAQPGFGLGTEFCPIILLGGQGDGSLAVRALREGCEDFLVKPIRCEELLARSDAILRRTGSRSGGDTVCAFRSFSIDTTRRLLLRGQEAIPLSTIEYTLLMYMTGHPDTVMGYQHLYETVWGSDSLGDTRTLMVHMSNLRKKLDPENLGLLQTVRGAGYKFSDQ